MAALPSSVEELQLLLEQLCGAASCETVNEVLGYRCGTAAAASSTSLNEPLLPGSRQANLVRETLFRQQQQKQQDEEGEGGIAISSLRSSISSELVVRIIKALLQSHSAYETCWETACDVVKHLHSSSNHAADWTRPQVQTCVAEIQAFLQQTVAFWWQEERRQILAVGAAVSSSDDNNNKKSSINTTRQPLSASETTSLSSTRGRTTPRFWILRLLQVVVEPLITSTPTTSSFVPAAVPKRRNEHWRITLELIPLIVSLSRSLDENLLNSCLDGVFLLGQHQRISHECLLPWLVVASELAQSSYLRDEDWDNLHHVTRQSLLSSGEGEQALLLEEVCASSSSRRRRWQDDLPGLAQALLSLSVSLMMSNSTNTSCTLNSNTTTTNNSHSKLTQWQELILRLLALASYDLSAYSTLETLLQSRISELPSSSLQLWTRCLVYSNNRNNNSHAATTSTDVTNHNNNDGIPTWIRCNLLLLILRTSRQSGSQMVAQLVVQAFGRSGSGSSSTTISSRNNSRQVGILELCWARLLHYLRSSAVSSSSENHHKNQGRSKLIINTNYTRQQQNEVLRRFFGGITYTGSGCFQDKQQKRVELISNAGRVVFQSLFLSSSSVSSSQEGTTSATTTLSSSLILYAMERGQAWVHTMLDRIQSCSSSSCSGSSKDHFQVVILAVTTLVIVFVELPVSRSSLVRSMLESFSSSDLQQESKGIVTSELVSRVFVLVISVVMASSSSLLVSDSTAASALVQQLSKSSSELDRISSVFTNNSRLSLQLLFSLADSLRSLPSARRSLLEAAQKCVQSPTTPYWGFHLPRWGSAARSSSSSYLMEQTDRLKFGLHSLITLTSSPCWGDTESEAWSMLSDILVASKPVPLEIRAWLLEHLEMHVKGRHLDQVAARHFLRALLFRLLEFFSGTSSQLGHGFCFLPDHLFISWGSFDTPSRSASRHIEAAEDLNGLFRTVLALTYFCADDQSSRTALSQWRRFLRGFVQQIPRNHEKVQEANQPAIPLSPEVLVSNPESDKGALLTHATMFAVFLFLRHVLGEDHLPLEAGTPSALELRKRIRLQEESAVSGARVRLTFVNSSSQIISGTGAPSNRSLAFENLAPHFDASCSTVCSTILVLLVGSEWTSQPGGDIESGVHLPTANDESKKLLAVGISVLYSCKRVELSCKIPQHHQITILSERTCTVCQVLDAFCSFALPVVESLLLSEAFEDLESLDRILAVVLDLCDVVYSLSEKGRIGPVDDPQLLVRLSRTVWRVHMTISEEQATLRLICCMEKAALARRSNTFETPPAKIFPESSSSIDSTVHALRSRVLRTFLCCFSGSEDSNSAIFQDFSLGSPESISSTVFTEHTVEVLNWMELLSLDLLHGIQGESGGLLYDLFVLFLDCIEACAARLRTSIQNCEVESSIFFRRVAVVSARVTDSIDLVVSSVTLKGSVAFKKSLSLSLSILPALTWLAMQMMVRAKDSYALDLSEIGNVAFLRTLRQCRNILDRKIECSMIQRVESWESIAGTEHTTKVLLSSDVEVDSDDESLSSNLDGRPVVRPSHGKSETARMPSSNSKPGDRHIQLHSERVWCWALSAIFQSTEDDLSDTANVLSDNASTFESNGDLARYLKNRVVHIKERSAAVGSFFEHKANTKYSESPQHSCMRALWLPSAAKFRLLSVVERNLVVLQRCLTVVAKFIRLPYSTKIIYSAACVEALSHVKCWLTSKSNHDLCIGVLQWFVAERKVAPPNSSIDDKNAPSSFVQKLQKTIVRAEQLESSLRRLNQELLDIEEVQTTKSLCARRIVSEISKRLFCGSNGKDDSGERCDLHWLVERKVKAIGDNRVIHDENNNKRRTPLIEQRLRQEKRKRNIRSRNQVVDQWLQMDRLIGCNDEAMEDDAYADLEDFLE